MEDNKENDYLVPTLQEKIDAQNQIMTLMQIQIDMQNEKVSKQGEEIEKLASEVEALKLLVAKLVSKNTILSDGISTTVSTSEKAGPDQNQTNKSDEAPVPSSVAEMARQTAEATLANSGFVYDETSGLYYDYSSGYYYDPNRKLYYNGHTKTYYSFNEAKSEYVFHSQLPPEVPNKKQTKSKLKQKKKRLKTDGTIAEREPETTAKLSSVNCKIDKPKRVSSPSSRNTVDLEDGELSSDSGSSVNIIEKEDSISSDSDATHGTVEINTDSDNEESRRKAEENTPCIRAIVLESESESPQLKKGFLFIVTCMGGTIGREGSHHAILIPDADVSRDHARITYDYPKEVSVDHVCEKKNKFEMEKKYFITDLGSMNGTFLNRIRLSPSTLKSEPFELVHGSILQIPGTQLLIHIHNGLMTCGHCEPGLVLENEVVILNGPRTSSQKEAIRKKILKKIRHKYAIGPAKASTIPKLMEKYKDRAQDRRHLLGSDHPSFKVPEAEPASIHVPIDEENKGFKMLKKMGWTAGESLGQSKEDGMREPNKEILLLAICPGSYLYECRHSSRPRSIDPSFLEVDDGRRVKGAFKEVVSEIKRNWRNKTFLLKVKFEVKIGRSGLGAVRRHGFDPSGSNPPPSHYPNGSGKKGKKARFLKKTMERYSAASFHADQGTSFSSMKKSKNQSSDVIQLD